MKTLIRLNSNKTFRRSFYSFSFLFLLAFLFSLSTTLAAGYCNPDLPGGQNCVEPNSITFTNSTSNYINNTYINVTANTTNLVPYTGATTNVDVGYNNITSQEYYLHRPSFPYEFILTSNGAPYEAGFNPALLYRNLDTNQTGISMQLGGNTIRFAPGVYSWNHAQFDIQTYFSQPVEIYNEAGDTDETDLLYIHNPSNAYNYFNIHQSLDGSSNSNSYAYFNNLNLLIGKETDDGSGSRVQVVGNVGVQGDVYANNLCYSNGTGCPTGSSYNSTYDLWAYNQTAPVISYFNQQIGLNYSAFISTYNSSYYLNSNPSGFYNSSTLNNTVYVPYNGATSNVDMNNKSLINISFLSSGTSTPDQVIDIRGTSSMMKYISSVGDLYLQNGGGSSHPSIIINASSTASPVLFDVYSQGTEAVYFQYLRASENTLKIFNNANLNLFAGSSSRIFINGSTGNVGIGKTNPTTTLDVNGGFIATNVNATGYYTGLLTGRSLNVTILKDADLVMLTKTYCHQNFTSGLLTWSDC